MNNFFFIATLLTLFYSCEEPNLVGEENPNFIFILADDLGYGEIGIQGQKWIETPNIDKLAKEGMI